MKKVLGEIKKALKSAKTALIISHVDPDGDSIGSMIAMGGVLDQLGIVKTLYYKEGIPQIYHFLNGTEEIKKTLPLSTKYDLVIVVDASAPDRLNDQIRLKEIAKRIINIDHHPDNENFGDINYISKTSSTAELIYQIILYLGTKIDQRIAAALYVALITDTGNFRYENTSEATFAMAAALLKAGVKTHELTTKVYDNKTIAALRIMAAALLNLQVSPDRKVAWASVNEEMMQKTGAKGEDLIGLVDQIRSIEGVEVALLFRQEKEKIKVNLRSKSKINVSEIAANFNGGGHAKAAGAVIVGDLDKVIVRVVAEAIKYVSAAQYLV